MVEKKHVIEAVKVEETTTGPRLIVAGVVVRQWLGTMYNDDAYDIAVRVRKALCAKLLGV